VDVDVISVTSFAAGLSGLTITLRSLDSRIKEVLH
jgi:hypothetical protein